MDNQNINIENINLENINQTGGFVQSIPGALLGVLKVVIMVFRFIFKILIFVIRALYPYIIKFLGFCIIVSILLTLFGFFGIFFTFCAIFLIYYKLMKKIKSGNLKFARELNKKATSESNLQYAWRTMGSKKKPNKISSVTETVSNELSNPLESAKKIMPNRDLKNSVTENK